MKSVQFPETPEELRNILVQGDLTLRINFSDFDYTILGDGYSADRLSIRDVMKVIVDVLGESGISVTWNTD